MRSSGIINAAEAERTLTHCQLHIFPKRLEISKAGSRITLKIASHST